MATIRILETSKVSPCWSHWLNKRWVNRNEQRAFPLRRKLEGEAENLTHWTKPIRLVWTRKRLARRPQPRSNTQDPSPRCQNPWNLSHYRLARREMPHSRVTASWLWRTKRYLAVNCLKCVHRAQRERVHLIHKWTRLLHRLVEAPTHNESCPRRHHLKIIWQRKDNQQSK